jgi:PBSX family phage terminase large subunit
MDVTIPYSPHAGQKKFHKSKAKYRAIITGVGFGKTAAGVNEMIKDCVEHPGTLNLIFAPTFPLLKNVTMREFWKFCPKEIIHAHNQSDHMVKFVNGSELVYLSGDNTRDIDRLRGLTIGAAYGDEVSLSPHYAWEIIIARLRDPKGSLKLWVSATPKGSGSWLQKLFVLKKDPRNGQPLENPQSYVVIGGSTLDNPHTPEEYKKTLLSTFTGAFRAQEIYGQFVASEGLVYQNFDMGLNIISQPPPGASQDFKRIIAGLDFGYTNPTAVIVGGVDGDGRLTIIDEVYERHLQSEQLVAVCKSLMEKHRKIECFYCDPSEPQYIQQLNTSGIHAAGVSSDVLPGIAKVACRLDKQLDGRPRLMVQENCVNTIMEFQSYRYPEGREGKAVKENPLKIHDHALDAIRMMVHMLDRDVYMEDDNPMSLNEFTDAGTRKITKLNWRGFG